MPDFITGLLGLFGVAGANAAGVLGAPVGPEATGAGLITAVVPALLSLSGLGGVSIIPRLITGFLGLFGRRIVAR